MSRDQRGRLAPHTTRKNTMRTPDGPSRPDKPTRDNLRFVSTWVLLATQGECDDEGSGEFYRVLSEWHNAGEPTRIARFIMDRANAPPTPPAAG